jgi:hypothetical protein
VHAERYVQGDHTVFALTDLTEQERQAAHTLGWQDTGEGFACRFPAGTRYLEQAYRNFERHAPTLIRRCLGLVTLPWSEALLAALQVLDSQPIDWYLVGSAALAVRGVGAVPGDIDLVTDFPGARLLEELLSEHLMQPLTPAPGWVAGWFARAFVSAQVEWVAEVNETADEPHPTDFGPEAARRLETVAWRGFEVRVPPLDLSLDVSRRRGLTDRVEQIERWLGK